MIDSTTIYCQKCSSIDVKIVSVSFGCQIETRIKTATHNYNFECLCCGHKWVGTCMSRDKYQEEIELWDKLHGTPL